MLKCGALLGLTAGLVGSVIFANARDNGQYSQVDPNIKKWIEGLKDGKGVSCCSDADGEEVEGWDFGINGYKVKVRGKWLDVSPSALLNEPNLLGFARVWLRWETGEPVVRCFIPGAGG